MSQNIVVNFFADRNVMLIRFGFVQQLSDVFRGVLPCWDSDPSTPLRMTEFCGPPRASAPTRNYYIIIRWDSLAGGPGYGSDMHRLHYQGKGVRFY